jgi:hypothetical protein
MKKITVYRIYHGSTYTDKRQISKVRRSIKGLTGRYNVVKYVRTKSGGYAPVVIWGDIYGRRY